jgi:predicted ATPase
MTRLRCRGCSAHDRAARHRSGQRLPRLGNDGLRHGGRATLVAPVYGWFTEGFDTLDLKEAKALLEELAS